MGNLIGKNSTETINWNNIKTDDMSPSIPNLKGLTKDARVLIKHLQVPNIEYLENSEVDNIFQKMSPRKIQQQQVAVEDSFSETSPFISSEMYKYLMANDNIEQNGGGKEKGCGKQNGGAEPDGDSSTSSTSTSEEDDKKKINDDKKEAEESDEKKNENNDSDSTSVNTLNGGSLSYISSSAHTEGKFSELESSSNINTSISMGNNNMLSNSINTSDINMISSDS